MKRCLTSVASIVTLGLMAGCITINILPDDDGATIALDREQNSEPVATRVRAPQW